MTCIVYGDFAVHFSAWIFRKILSRTCTDIVRTLEKQSILALHNKDSLERHNLQIFQISGAILPLKMISAITWESIQKKICHALGFFPFFLQPAVSSSLLRFILTAASCIQISNVYVVSNIPMLAIYVRWLYFICNDNLRS